MTRALMPWRRGLHRPLERLEDEFAGLMEKFLGPETESWTNGLEFFQPRANLAESETGFETTVELPGMKPEDVHVEFKNGELWITGEMKEEHEKKDKTFHRVERRTGEFRRIIRFPSAVNEDKVQAVCKDGILTVTIPKAEAAKSKKIAVKA